MACVMAYVHDESLRHRLHGLHGCLSGSQQRREGVSRLTTLFAASRRGRFLDAAHRFFRHSCQHCDHAPCVDVRPTGASFRDAASGIVDVNPDLASAASTALPRVLTACALSIRSVSTADKCDCRKTNPKAGKHSPALSHARRRGAGLVI